MNEFKTGDRVKCKTPQAYGRVGEVIYATVVQGNSPFKNSIRIIADHPSQSARDILAYSPTGSIVYIRNWELVKPSNEDDFEEEWI